MFSITEIFSEIAAVESLLEDIPASLGESGRFVSKKKYARLPRSGGSRENWFLALWKSGIIDLGGFGRVFLGCRADLLLAGGISDAREPGGVGRIFFATLPGGSRADFLDQAAQGGFQNDQILIKYCLKLVVVAPFGLKLGENGATTSGYIFKYLPSLLEPIFGKK